jgi:hypothetical protein
MTLGGLERRLARLEQEELRRLLQRLRDAQTPREIDLAGQAVTEAMGRDADLRAAAATLAGALDLDPDELLAEAERLADHPDEFRDLKAELMGVLDG